MPLSTAWFLSSNLLVQELRNNQLKESIGELVKKYQTTEAPVGSTGRV